MASFIAAFPLASNSKTKRTTLNTAPRRAQPTSCTSPTERQRSVRPRQPSSPPFKAQNNSTGESPTANNAYLGPSSKFFATCARGLGEVLSEELRTHPAILADIEYVASSGVHFTTPNLKSTYAVPLWLRSATRILNHLFTFTLSSSTETSIYDAIRENCDWCHLLNNGKLTFSIQVRHPSIPNSNFDNIGLTVKNAICDSLRDKGHEKPDKPLNYAESDIPLFIAISEYNEISMYRDMVGTSLHKRGYRSDDLIHKSSLNESAAAGMLYLAGFTPLGNYENNPKNKDLLIIDPMCGSATLLIETILLHLQIAPGLYRPAKYPFQKWHDFDPVIFNEVCEEARNSEKPVRGSKIFCIGSDINSSAISIAKNAIEYTGFHDLIKVQCCDIRDLTINNDFNDMKRIVISNPPWGRRLKGEGDAWTEFGRFLRREAYDKSDNGEDDELMKTVLLSGDANVTRPLRMKARVKYPLRIGNVDARVLVYDVLPKKKADDSTLMAEKTDDGILMAEETETNTRTEEDPVVVQN